MITKLNKIKNLGAVFTEYSWSSTLPLFQKFNVIYGWNGSGKTTLSRLFNSIQGFSLADVEFEIEDEQGHKYKQGEVFAQRIRTFNQDYVLQNVKIIEGRANAISILLGEENRELANSIENDRRLLHGDAADKLNTGKIATRDEKIRDRDSKVKQSNEKFTEIAKTIGAAIGGKALRDYRSPQAKEDFKAIQQPELLSNGDLQKYSIAATQEALSSIDDLELKLIKYKSGDEVDIPFALETIVHDSELLLKKTVESEVISRLAEHQDVSQWVEEGLSLHDKHSSTVCEFCQQKFPAARFDQLKRHFNEADKELKDDVDSIISSLIAIRSAIDALSIPDKARIYSDLHISYEDGLAEYLQAKKELLSNIGALTEELRGKKSKTTESMVLFSHVRSDDFTSRLSNLRAIISKCNKTTEGFAAVKQDAIKKLKRHYLSTIYDDVIAFGSDIALLNEDIDALGSEIAEIETRIAQNTAKISSKHKACELLNEKLITFLGHNELSFSPHLEKSSATGKEEGVVTGYNILRAGKPAAYLSEGEKTAIAFVYFVVHLVDQDFSVRDGIIVIDDPISSLDSNSLYQAFSFLKNSVKDAGQVFVLTHNFDFLRLIINWRKNVPKRVSQTEYYMVKNRFTNGVRRAYLDKMDKELYEYESEYHYLFKLLKQLRTDQDDTITKAYPVPNIARKVWETFLMFRVPSGKNQYQKMEELKGQGYDSQKLDAIYKFTNDQSHITGSGFNPALVQETKKVVGELFEMMRVIAPEHFRIIDAATTEP